MALDRNTKDRRYRFIPILGPGADPESLPAFVAQHQWLDLRDGEAEPARIRKLVGAILSRPPEAVSLLPPGEAPFRGLSSFDSRHAHLFFGRDRETQELVEAARTAPFLTVMGDSGSGKSSLVKAGLIPALYAGRFLDGGSPVVDWHIVTLRPGSDPFRELATGLMELQPESEVAARIAAREEIAAQLRQGSQGLLDCIGSLVPRGARTLLLVDQFEEVFTQSADTGERDRFIDMLLEATSATGDRPLHTLITLRADFYGECFEHPTLPKAIAANLYAVRAIDSEQMAEVVEKPAAMAGLKLEPGLVEAILFDLGEGPSNLALLQHTLLQLWNQRSGETLTHATYEAIGRVQGALEHHAEDVFAHLSADEAKQARRLLLQLVVPGKEGGATRRRACIKDLLPAGESREIGRRVLKRLVEQRLLSVSRSMGDDEGEETVEVVHESLLRGWKRLRDWLDKDWEFLFWRQRMRAAFDAWQESGCDSGALLGGGPLAEARRWLAERVEEMSEGGRKSKINQ